MQNSSNLSLPGEYTPVKLNKDFPITFPSFTKPPSLSHIHDCFEIGFCFQGSGVFLIEEKIFSCSMGEAVFINSREFHLLRDSTPSNSRWKFINLDPVKLLMEHVLTWNKIVDMSCFSGPEFRNVISSNSHPDIINLVKDLIKELEQQLPGYKESVVGIIWILFVKLHRLAPNHSTEPDTGNSKTRIAPALHYIATNYADSLTINKLASLCNCSISNFRKIFTKSMKCSPLEYLIRFRLIAACAMLKNSDKQIVSIASEVGFYTLSNFNRSFKKMFNISPREYKKDQKTYNKKNSKIEV